MQLKDFSKLVRKIRQRRRQRHDYQRLLTLENRLLRDMGVTRADVYQMARKPFWGD